MAASYWDSSQRRQWTLAKYQRFLGKECPLLDGVSARKLQLFYCHFVQRVGRQMSLPQRIIAVALMYFHRFYSRFTYVDHDPWIMMPACLFLAAKVEENAQQSRFLLAATQQLATETIEDWSYHESDIIEAESRLLIGLDFSLLVHLPYRPLVTFLADSHLGELLNDSCAVINDSFKTDLCLEYPPHIIALGCLLVAAAAREKQTEAAALVSSLAVKLDLVARVVDELLDFYDFWNVFSFAEAKQIARNFDEQLHPSTLLDG
jgi:cyclin C